MEVTDLIKYLTDRVEKLEARVAILEFKDIRTNKMFDLPPTVAY